VGGHSNVTYVLQRGDSRFVLRRPPRPPFPASAHDVVREARILVALRSAGGRVPKVLCICELPGVIGAPFCVMEYLDGSVFGNLPNNLRDESRAFVARQTVAELAQLHAIDITIPAIAALGRPSGYLGRQLRRFAAIWDSQRTRELPEVDAVGDWLLSNQPTEAGTAIVHGDFRLGNVMFDRDERPKLLAVLDWEMATLGDPLADLGYLCATWAQAGDTENPILALSAATRLPGFPTRDDIRQQYAALTGRDVGGLNWYEVLAMWKTTIFLESSYRRYIQGRAGDPYFASLEHGVPEIAQAAARRMREHPGGAVSRLKAKCTNE
jgi:aminoglycoside phosphotransferase (APT) family kinase protein